MIIPEATYTLYSEISKVMGATVVKVPMEDVHVSLSAMAEKVTEKTKLIWLANPNNPTGTVVSPKAFRTFLAHLPDHTWVILDEAYAEFADDTLLPDRVSLIREGHSVISVRTFSKAYGLAGARLGYAIASSQVISAINTVSEPFNANRVAIAGALAAINEDRDHFTRIVGTLKEERAFTHSRPPGAGAAGDSLPSQLHYV